MRKLRTLAAIAALPAAIYGGSVSAHHSGAMFDDKKTETIVGNVKEFQYTQPHCWLVVLVPAKDGSKAQEYRIEAGAPTQLIRIGIKKSTFPEGEKVTVKFHPLKDGRPAGEFVSVIRADGTEVGMRGAPPPPAAGGAGAGAGAPPQQ